MSIVLKVFLPSAKLPSASVWAKAIRSCAYAMELDEHFDPATATGSWPCTYQNQLAGFTYSRGTTAGAVLEADVKARIGARDVELTFSASADPRAQVSAIIASSVLCAMAGGILWDVQGHALVSAVQAIAWGKAGEASLREAIELAERR